MTLIPSLLSQIWNEIEIDRKYISIGLKEYDILFLRILHECNVTIGI